MKGVYTQWIPKNVLLRCQVVSSYISFYCCFPSSALSKQQNFLQCTVIKRYFSFFLLFSLFVWIPLIFLTFMLAYVRMRVYASEFCVLLYFVISFCTPTSKLLRLFVKLASFYLPPFNFTYINNSHTYTTTDAHTSYFQHYIFIFILHSPPSVTFFVLQIESSRLLFVVAASSFVPISSCSFGLSLSPDMLFCKHYCFCCVCSVVFSYWTFFHFLLYEVFCSCIYLS